MTAERMLELETKIDMFMLSGFDFLKSGDFSNKDIVYILTAVHLSYFELSKKLEEYNCSCTGMNEMLFVSDMCMNYGVDRCIMIKRLRQVKKLIIIFL